MSPFIETSSTPLENLLDLVKDRLGAVTAVIEPYVSTDWNSEYSVVYSRMFQPPVHLAKRIHFFHEVMDYDDLKNLPKRIKDSYLGFTVLRPLEHHRVGDTVLASPWRIGSGADLVHCLEKFNVSLLGNRLIVKGMPFFQQERLVGVCAHADLWMISRYLNRKSETRRYRPDEIHPCAIRGLTVGPPREGLLFEQITNALRDFGLNPILRSAQMDFRQAKEFVYSCVESEIPVIAAIKIADVGRHVVVLIGHDYSNTISGTTISLSEAVGNFIVHDDSHGPYKKMATGSVPFDSGEGQPIDILTLDCHRIEYFIVPFPPRVHMEWKEAQLISRVWIQCIIEYIAGLFKIEKSKLWAAEEMENLVIRTFLRLSSSFKEDIFGPQAGQLRDEAVIDKYRCMKMPKYIWVVELAKRSELQNISLDERKIRGEIILDSTGRRETPEKALMAFHLNGIMFVPGQEGKPSELIVTEETPYSPLLRRQSI